MGGQCELLVNSLTFEVLSLNGSKLICFVTQVERSWVHRRSPKLQGPNENLYRRRRPALGRRIDKAANIINTSAKRLDCQQGCRAWCFWRHKCALQLLANYVTRNFNLFLVMIPHDTMRAGNLPCGYLLVVIETLATLPLRSAKRQRRLWRMENCLLIRWRLNCLTRSDLEHVVWSKSFGMSK